MAGHSSTNTEYLTRTQLWDSDLKKMLRADLMAQKWVRMIDFPEGDTLNIPSLGQMEVSDYVEGQQARYTALDTGNFTFTIDQYKQGGTFITRKAQQDLYYAAQLQAAFVPEIMRSLSEEMEARALAVIPEAQTAGAANAINGANHRWVGSGTSETMDVTDFAKAAIALDMAYVPRVNRIAIVDPSVEYKLNTLTNLVNVSNNPHFEGIINTGHRTGLRFSRNIFGFDVYVSHFLKKSLAETIGGKTTTTGVANLFFSAQPGMNMPIIGAVRQEPRVDYEFNKDFQRDEWVVTCRYGYKLFRPENAVVVITDNDQVTF